MTTGERMKARRKELGLSAEYVADKLGVSPSTIYRYEKGDIEKMPGNVLSPIADILSTTPAYLMGWEEEEEKDPAPEELVNGDPELTELLTRARDDPNIRMLFSVTKNATPEDIEKTIKIIKMLRGE